MTDPCDEVELVGPVEPKRLDTVMSVRIDPDRIVTLRRIAEGRGGTVSDLLRAAADWIVEMTGPELDELLICRSCRGTGMRVRRLADSASDAVDGTPS